MKKSIFKILLVLGSFLFANFTYSQVKLKSNKFINQHKKHKKNGKTVIISGPKVNIKNPVIVKKPKHPKVIVKKPKRLRPGYVWVSGYWKWNNYLGRYVWQRARWKKIRKGHNWVSGYWEIAPGGFIWVSGYWSPY